MHLSAESESFSEAGVRKLLRELPEIDYGEVKFRHRLEMLPLVALDFCWRLLPETVALGCAKALLSALAVFLRRRNSLAREHIARILGCDENDARVGAALRSSYHFLAENAVWMARLKSDIRSSDTFSKVKGEGLEWFGKMRDEGRGVVVATGHLGLWERSPLYLDHFGYPLAMMAAVQHNPLFDRFLNRRRETGASRVVHNRLGVRHLLRYLKQGGRLAIVADIDVGDKGIFAPFLDLPASTSKWPAQLALHTGAALLVGYVYRNAEGVDVLRMNPPIDCSSGDILQITTEMNRQLSRTVREVPGQWFWLQRRWKTRPPEAMAQSAAQAAR